MNERGFFYREGDEEGEERVGGSRREGYFGDGGVMGRVVVVCVGWWVGEGRVG